MPHDAEKGSYNNFTLEDPLEKQEMIMEYFVSDLVLSIEWLAKQIPSHLPAADSWREETGTYQISTWMNAEYLTERNGLRPRNQLLGHCK